MKIIDLRSDTVTLPTAEMRKAMFEAELGDDVFEEDPTAIKLEQIAAKLVGTEAALLVPSGTMANLVCILTHCDRGDEVILGDKSHTFLNEVGGISALGGIHPHTVSNQIDGTMRLEDIEAAIRGDDVHWPRTKLICLENTHNRCHGAPLTPQYFESVAALAKTYDILVHLDGARIFNAVVALEVDVKQYTKHVDSLSFCLSKGLSAPIGSVVCGRRDFIAEARRTRKLLGGGMRQVGIIAAPGIVALETMIDRLKIDHENARYLANGIKQIPGLSIDVTLVKTNIIYCDLVTKRMTPNEFMVQLEAKGIKILQTGPKSFRMVTHYGVERVDIDRALKILHEISEQS
jgi:threonine aldolase